MGSIASCVCYINYFNKLMGLNLQVSCLKTEGQVIHAACVCYRVNNDRKHDFLNPLYMCTLYSQLGNFFFFVHFGKNLHIWNGEIVRENHVYTTQVPF